MSSVSIIKCGSYDAAEVKNAIKQSIDYLGGMSAFIGPDDRVLLKANLLMKRKPEFATTTHPSIVQAIAELVAEAGGKAVIGDSPGGNYSNSRKNMEALFETCGMKQAAEKSGAELNYDTEIVDVPYPEGKIMKTVKTIKPVLDADKIINIPKLKTHVMMVYSGTVKNLFGIIPGSYKRDYHLRFDDVKEFAELLTDICLFAKPVLNIMDAVVGMEGYGPTTGKPKKIGLIIASADPFALDVVASRIIGLKPEQVPTIKKSMERGLCSGNINDIKIFGEQIENVMVRDFKKSTLKISMNFYSTILPHFISKRINRAVKPRPCFEHDICKGCGICAKSCPPKVIEMINEKPSVNLDGCIRCFCCHELCSYGAITIKRPWLIKLLLG